MPTVLQLLETMVHDMPRGKAKPDSDDGVRLSEAVTTLAADTDRFIRESMLLPALEESREIVDVDGDGLVPRLVREVLLDHSRLPEHSRAIALHLHECQSGVASAGVFMASTAEMDGQPRVIILKAEHQEGVRLRQVGSSAHVAFEVDHIRELIVGKNSRVYKIAVLWVEDDGVRGLMVDRQNGAAYADYFLGAFLGMELAHDSEVVTKSFVDAATRFIADEDLSSDTRKRYATAVTALLESPDPWINPQQFIHSFIDPDDRDDFEAILPPAAQARFRKDITQVKSLVGGVRMVMPSGNVSVTATTEALENGEVVLEEDGPDGPRVVIPGDPASIKLARPPKQ